MILLSKTSDARFTVSTPIAVGYMQKESVELFVICTEVLTKPKDE